MGITASLSRRRRYDRHQENYETQEVDSLEKIKEKVIRKPRVELVFLLDVTLTRAIEKNQHRIVLSLTDPVFIRNMIFNLPLDCVESFADLLSLIARKTRQNGEKLANLVESALFLHPVQLPDNGYERLRQLDLSNTSIYLLNNYTHSNLQVPEDNLNVSRVVASLSGQEVMDDVQQGRFTAFVTKNNGKIKLEIEPILNRVSPIQLKLILERLDYIDKLLVRQIANHFNRHVENCDTTYRDLRRPSQFVRNFVASPIMEQWINCFRLFVEGENKNELVDELRSCNDVYLPITEYIINNLEH